MTYKDLSDLIKMTQELKFGILFGQLIVNLINRMVSECRGCRVSNPGPLAQSASLLMNYLSQM